METYRIKEYDVVNDIWILQKRVFGIFWKSLGVGSKRKLHEKINNLSHDNMGDI